VFLSRNFTQCFPDKGGGAGGDEADGGNAGAEGGVGGWGAQEEQQLVLSAHVGDTSG